MSIISYWFLSLFSSVSNWRKANKKRYLQISSTGVRGGCHDTKSDSNTHASPAEGLFYTVQIKTLCIWRICLLPSLLNIKYQHIFLFHPFFLFLFPFFFFSSCTIAWHSLNLPFVTIPPLRETILYLPPNKYPIT